MPQYLKKFVTEFNFLFHQIYKVAYNEDYDCHYTYGNNVRRFLEIFLYYKYPKDENQDDKLTRFFGDKDSAMSLIQRISNEFSHSQGVFERAALPMDISEMQRSAKFILQKIKKKDRDQYQALLDSIGATDKSGT